MREGWQGAGAPEGAGTGGGTTFALDLFGQAGAVGATPQKASAQGGTSGLPEMVGGESGLSGAAGISPEEAAARETAVGKALRHALAGAAGELAQTDAANGPGAEANGLPGAAANGLPGADAAEDELAQAGIQAGELAQPDAEAGEANGADVPNGQAGEASRDGAEAGEAEALLRAMRAQYGLPEAGAAELLAAFGEDRARGQHIREQAVRQAAFRGVMGEYLSMLREADGLRARYAGFSLPELLEDARFLGMLRAGLSMEDAYLAMHGREVLRQAIAATHRWTERQLRAAWAAESRRPAEGAMTGGSTALSRTNPAQMTRAQREAIARRVLKGERVLL